MKMSDLYIGQDCNMYRVFLWRVGFILVLCFHSIMFDTLLSMRNTIAIITARATA